MVKRYHTLERIFTILAKYVKDSEHSFNEITRRVQAQGYENITEYKIRNVSNGRFEENKIMVAIDYYVSSILYVLGKTDDELLSDAAHLDIRAHKKRFNKKIEEFLDMPNVEDYLEYARLMYIRDITNKELKAFSEFAKGEKAPQE